MGDKSVHTIGVKVLTKELMGCNFKHTDSILQSIENCRSIAAENQDEFNKLLSKDPDDAVMVARGYNNAISILGSRGSGKTSIIMTLQYILRYGKRYWETSKPEDKKELQENIIMPILVPQDFVRGQDLLSWVIVQLLEKAEDIEKEINKCGNISLGKRGPFKTWVSDKCENQFEDPLRECMDSLKYSYELRYKIIKQSCDQVNHVFQYMDEVKKDAKLVCDMLKLISMLTDYYRFCSPDEREPLLFFVIDDLDLAPDRSQEVLNLVLRYLQHPNIVVICGWNQELFQTHLTMEVLRNQGITDGEMIEVNGDYVDVFMTRQRKRVSLLDSARRLSMDNLKKAFPPALRYEVRGFDTEQRACFPREKFEEYQDKHEFGSLIDLIEKALLASRNPSRRKTDIIAGKTVDFLRNAQNEFLNVYMRIFDNKSRGLINTYHAFETIKTYFEDRNRDEALDITPMLQSLLDTILFSNTHFFPYKRGLRDLIKIDKIVLQPEDSKEENECDFYCNYQQIVPVLQKYRTKIELAENQIYLSEDEYKVESEYNYFPSLVIDVFILLNFMENLMRYICGLPLYEHGGHAFFEALNDVIPPIKLFSNDDNMLSNTIISANIKEIALFPDTDNFRINLWLLNAYEKEKFRDGQYDFTGSYSYCRIARAISGLLRIGGKDCNKKQLSENTRKHMEIIIKQLKESPWLQSMNDLFLSLVYNQKNVERLTRFRCFALQQIFDEEEMIRQAINLRYVPFSDKYNELSQENKRKINNYDLDTIVNILRELDKLDTFVLKPKDMEEDTNNIWSSIKKDPELFDQYMITKGIALEFEPFAKMPLKTWIEKPDDIYFTLLKIHSSRAKKPRSSEIYNDYNLSTCEKCMTSLKNVMLWNLRMRLYCSFQNQYNLRQTRADKFTYLLKSSSVIAQYVERWKIGCQIWSNEEENAVDRLLEIFQSLGQAEAYRYASIIARNEPNYEGASQIDYAKALADLKQWFVNNGKRVNASKRIDIDNQLRILQRSAGIETQQYNVDNEILDVLIDLGKNIAEECAGIAYCDELSKDLTSGERDRVAWPIIKSSRQFFVDWQEQNKDLAVENDFQNNTLFG